MTTTTLHYEGIADLIDETGKVLETVTVRLQKTPAQAERLGHWEGTFILPPGDDSPSRLNPGQFTLRLKTGRSAYAMIPTITYPLTPGRPMQLLGSGPPPF